MTDYWNHNVAFHGWVLRRAHGRVLDVGCGDGLLLRKLRQRGLDATGVEPDPRHAAPGVITTDFLALPDEEAYDTVVFVASLHHMDAESALKKAKALLRPGGTLLVVGLTRNVSVADWVVAGGNALVCAIADRRPDRGDPDVIMADPREGLAELRAIAETLLPGVSVRRALFYRYLLEWTK